MRKEAKLRIKSITGYPSTIPCVKCESCNHLHPVDEETFLVVYGNITIGISGGVVGNNLEDGHLTRCSVFCRKSPNNHSVSCLEDLLRRQDS